MKISEIYHKYKILPTLQTHQFRVASVAKLIALNSTKPVEIENIVTACLLHDMGNVIKFNFKHSPIAMSEKDMEYAKQVQAEFILKYGKDQHNATIEIAKDIGVSKRVIDLINNISHNRSEAVYKSGDLNMMICQYSDKRVAPMGVLSLEDRMSEIFARYRKAKSEYNTKENIAECNELLGYLRLMEKEIFKNSKIKPEDVDDKSIANLMDDLIMQDNFVLG